MDLTTHTDEGLDDLRREVLLEQERRAIVASAPVQADAISRRYLRAVGRLPDHAQGAPPPWVKPEESYEAYPQDTTVAHSGKEWVSEQRTNMQEPGTSPDWREVPPEATTPA